MTLNEFNRLPAPQAAEELYRCCASKKWAEALATKRPFANLNAVCTTGDEVWFKLDHREWLEAFSHHPQIGGDISKMREKFPSQEQAGINGADEQTLQGLSKGNLEYEMKFGHVFLICATGKSAQEMLTALNSRMKNSAEQELKNAATEQSKIFKLRLAKLLENK